MSRGYPSHRVGRGGGFRMCPCPELGRPYDAPCTGMPLRVGRRARAYGAVHAAPHPCKRRAAWHGVIVALAATRCEKLRTPGNQSTKTVMKEILISPVRSSACVCLLQRCLADAYASCLAVRVRIGRPARPCAESCSPALLLLQGRCHVADAQQVVRCAAALTNRRAPPSDAHDARAALWPGEMRWHPRRVVSCRAPAPVPSVGFCFEHGRGRLPRSL